MPTKTTTDPNAQASSGFGDEAPDLILKPMLCVGTPTVSDEVVESQNSDYVWFDVNLEPIGSGRKTRVRIMFRPSWLSRDFNPTKDLAYNTELGESAVAQRNADPSRLDAEAKEVLDTRGQFYVYRGNIVHKEGTAHLQCLAGVGSEKANLFPKIVEKMKEIWTKQEFVTPEQFRQITASVVTVLTSKNAKWWYLLMQESTKDDSGDRVKTDRYEVKAWGIAEKKALDAQIKRAKKNGYEVTFEVTG